ncbi:hypothetical protein BY996DRAFT_6519288 [Phakopsora pachyrhizi]|uniref:Uncharacterized protein n=1 Tax=Phakopsora pachyrhizi TaxID=170000 RepID=A0AAV0BVQ1_PHAPC|nr:hypothetical protein BY996DRAFT_6519288 [Phakopsora pachyrhizi]CAH7690878.1 hypothetical protein PPACK8108_LOCUS26337 [Phakopsora pachyrhizi]
MAQNHDQHAHLNFSGAGDQTEYGLLLGISQRSKLPFPAPYENIQRTKLRLDEYREQ